MSNERPFFCTLSVNILRIKPREAQPEGIFFASQIRIRAKLADADRQVDQSSVIRNSSIIRSFLRHDFSHTYTFRIHIRRKSTDKRGQIT